MNAARRGVHTHHGNHLSCDGGVLGFCTTKADANRRCAPGEANEKEYKEGTFAESIRDFLIGFVVCNGDNKVGNRNSVAWLKAFALAVVNQTQAVVREHEYVARVRVSVKHIRAEDLVSVDLEERVKPEK